MKKFLMVMMMSTCSSVFALHSYVHVMKPVQFEEGSGLYEFVLGKGEVFEAHLDGILLDTYNHESVDSYSYWEVTGGHVDVDIVGWTDRTIWNFSGDEIYSSTGTGPLTGGLNVERIYLTVHTWELFEGGYTMENEPYHHGGYMPSSYSIRLEDASGGYFTLKTVPVPAAAWLFGTALIGLMGVKRKKQIVLITRT
ncbi:VPLPA-CTERM sorting domain-containing protein [bacterium]|nr:VPLPA-CTERM sorting domain-containing protein [bacterium]